eukprot:TRINITY_DN14271_c0_g1_i1.p1 TRINITY_DN14271_c0_g1~~TRINITY_DN14271_c0_g1_i1.p1  ORF type:complete len:359 (-),score=62.19 TRINITY_DN14271_c0_g1_i1:243-1319(-)
MPFILRRDKKQVLKELPEKIIQDYYCYKTDLQNDLYKFLQDNDIHQCNKNVDDIIQNLNQATGSSNETTNSSHNAESSTFQNVLQMLSQLRKLVDHPKLLFSNAKHSQQFSKFVLTDKTILNSYECSGKFLAFKQLLNDLGFDDLNQKEFDNQQLNIQNKNKILVFSRFKEVLQLIEQQLFKKIFPYIKYLKLDGDVPVNKRYGVVNTFNEDPAYSALLLTTQIGGLGLNLSSANIVIMFDHDYNPMKDLQAIDRAHRIGQKNILNVYRLMMKDTLEEQIMGIQRFKINITNAVINLDNSSSQNVENSNLIQLFDSIQQAKQSKNDKSQPTSKFMPYGKLLADVPEEMWEEQNYNAEY